MNNLRERLISREHVKLGGLQRQVSSTCRLLPSQRQEILRTLDGFGDLPQQLLQVIVAVHEINLRRIHNQQVGRCVVKEKMLVSLDHFSQVLITDRLLARSVLFLQTLFEHFWSGLQVDDEIRGGPLFAEKIVVAVVGFQLQVAQVQAGKELIFLKNKIRDHGFLRLRAQVERVQQLEAAHQKIELRLKGSPGFPSVKRSQK